jgi:lipopolysaccharide export system permease protein
MKLALYLAKNIISSTLLVLCIGLSLLFFINFLGEMSSIGTENYNFIAALKYVLCLTPLSVYQIFPTVVLIGLLLGLGALASSQELTIMRTAGQSILKITGQVLLAVLFMTIIAESIGEGIAPSLLSYGNNQKLIAQSNGQILNTINGLWLREGNDFYHINSVSSHAQMLGVTEFQFNDDEKLLSSTYATEADLINGQWVLKNGVSTSFTKDTPTRSQFLQAPWDLSLHIDLLKPQDPNTLTLPELNRQIKAQEDLGFNVSGLLLQWWTRFFAPLYTLIMALISIPFVFGPLRSVSIGLRLLSGIVVGLLFFIANSVLAPLSLVFAIPAPMAALISPLLFLSFAVVLFWLRR